jgi:hypothetical protein
MTKRPTAKQIAARRKFAAMAKAGMFRKKKKSKRPVKRQLAAKKNPRNPKIEGETARNAAVRAKPRTLAAAQKIIRRQMPDASGARVKALAQSAMRIAKGASPEYRELRADITAKARRGAAKKNPVTKAMKFIVIRRDPRTGDVFRVGRQTFANRAAASAYAKKFQAGDNSFIYEARVYTPRKKRSAAKKNPRAFGQKNRLIRVTKRTRDGYKYLYLKGPGFVADAAKADRFGPQAAVAKMREIKHYVPSSLYALQVVER